MLHRDAKCVYVANTIGEADVVASWLQEHGIAAEVMNGESTGTLMLALATKPGVEVWVSNPAQAPEAIRLLGEHAVDLVTKTQTGSPVNAVCEECGKTSTFPAQERGSVQSCPHCGAYLDVEPADDVEEYQQPTESKGKSSGKDAITKKIPGTYEEREDAP